ncbi:hypothetical protein LY78DRAFT_65499 [Colletotrichum sublineola]|nr:hypothetical protein LY78DRAFT_65499 [Colletotrichum sublineola]
MGIVPQSVELTRGTRGGRRGRVTGYRSPRNPALRPVLGVVMPRRPLQRPLQARGPDSFRGMRGEKNIHVTDGTWQAWRVQLILLTITCAITAYCG